METTDLIQVLQELQIKISECDSLGSYQARFLTSVSQIKRQYEEIDVAEKFREVYESLVAKGKKMIKCFTVSADPKDLRGKLNYYCNYLLAAYGDFTGQTYRITTFYRTFLLCSILFLALSPMFLTPIFPIIFIIPIILAMKGIKQRSKSAWWLSMLIVPVSLMTSILWVRQGIYVIGNLQAAVSAMMASSGMSSSVCTVFTIACPILGTVLLVLAGVLLYRGNQVKNLFV